MQEFRKRISREDPSSLRYDGRDVKEAKDRSMIQFGAGFAKIYLTSWANLKSDPSYGLTPFQ